MYFVLVYDRQRGDADIRRVFDQNAASEAVAYRLQVEAENAPFDEREVVLLGSSSEAEMRVTHARYFSTPAEILSRQATDPTGRSVA